MNLIPASPAWLVVLLALALAAAAVEDFLRLRISNPTCLAVFILGLVAMAMQGLSIALWQNLAVFTALLAGGTLLFASGKVGGGDVKLLAALGLWFDLRSAVWLLVAVFLCGGALALIFMAARLPRRGRPSVGKGIPYGLAIVAGGSLVIASQLGWMKSGYDAHNPMEVRPIG